MKKFIPFFLILLSTLFLQQSNAQLIACNAAFTTQFVTGSSVKVIPVTAAADTNFVLHYWSFGDGSNISAVSSTHTYLNNGTYTILHYIIRQTPNNVTYCTDSVSHTITIQQAGCNLNASFYWTTAPTNNLSQTFYNTSYNFLAGDSIRWTFGDGTSSTLINPTHVYNNAGIYTVCLRVQKATTASGTTACIREICMQDTISTVLPPPVCTLSANFTWYRDSLVTTPNSYHFTNTTVVLNSSDSIRWTFGDGTTSNQVNPNHAYTSTGTYNVCLRVIKRNANGSLSNCISEKCYTVVVIAPINLCNYQVYFSSLVDSAHSNILHFTNLTPGYLPTDSITWTFGDGTISHDVNPNHTYTVAGNYNVCLKIIRYTTAGSTPCIREYCKVITVVLPPPVCTLSANFTWYRDSLVTTPNSYHFTNTTFVLNSSDSIRWTFGDGTTSNQVNPNHAFTSTGTYNVCLRVIKRNANGSLSNCNSEKCYTVVVIAPINLCNYQVYFSSLADSAHSNILHFTNLTPGYLPTDSITWTFGDGTIS
ncbi:MAG: PKD domain-containing protein, partial [Ferruginibacter sp.]